MWSDRPCRAAALDQDHQRPPIDHTRAAIARSPSTTSGVFLTRHWGIGCHTQRCAEEQGMQGGPKNMSTTSRVAGAVATGYVLGRFKKLRLAVLVGSAMASPKFRNAAAGMIENRIPGGAITTTLTKEVGGRLVNIGKTAATSIVASRIDNLSQSLADRSQNLRGGKSGEQADKSRADGEED